jgi:hypothetical protein
MESKEEPVKRKRGAQPGHPHWRPPGSKGAPKGHPPYPGGGKPLYWNEERINEIADYFLEFIEEPSTLCFKEFALWLRQNKNIFFNKSYFGLFAERSEKFKEIYEYAQLIQEVKITKGGLLKKLDSQLTKFLLCAVHGYTDKQTIQHEGNDVINIVHYGTQEPKTWNQQQKNKLKEKNNEL